MDTSEFPVPQMNFVEDGRVCFGVCVFVCVSAFSKDTSRTKRKQEENERGDYPPSADGSNKGCN